jgi:UDP-N-acetyl-D-mannosaminuronate dehydrogenase
VEILLLKQLRNEKLPLHCVKILDKNMKTICGILGMGQIGIALKNVLLPHFRVYGKDRHYDEMKEHKIDILHIAIPCEKPLFFIKTACQSIKKNRPSLVIIDSTVAIGVTRKISEKCAGVKICHSPVRGVHPHLEKGLLTFVKYVGGIDKKSTKAGCRHFKKIGIKTKGIIGPENTEALKLWDTTYYGLCIIFEKELHRFCQKLNLDFNLIYKEANQTYNIGYTKLNMHYVIRPVLKHMRGPIGGHCILSNCKILHKQSNSKIPRLILEQNRLIKN